MQWSTITGLQLEVVYHATTLSGLQFWTFALFCHFFLLDKGVSFFDDEYKVKSTAVKGGNFDIVKMLTDRQFKL